MKSFSQHTGGQLEIDSRIECVRATTVAVALCSSWDVVDVDTLRDCRSRVEPGSGPERYRRNLLSTFDP